MKKVKPLHSIYIVLPYDIFSSREISANAKLILGEIVSLLKVERPFVFASNSHFSGLFGLNKATISYHINRLSKLGYINTEVFEKGCKGFNCPIKNKENHRHIYPASKLLTLLENSNTLFEISGYPYQGKPTKDNTNNKNNNKRSSSNIKIVKTTRKKYSSLKDITRDDIQEIANRYKVSVGFVSLAFEKLKNYCQAKGKRYKNYKSALRNFVLGDMQRQIERRQLDEKKRAIDASSIR